MGAANTRRRYIIASSLIDWAHAKCAPEILIIPYVTVNPWQVEHIHVYISVHTHLNFDIEFRVCVPQEHPVTVTCLNTLVKPGEKCNGVRTYSSHRSESILEKGKYVNISHVLQKYW